MEEVRDGGHTPGPSTGEWGWRSSGGEVETKPRRAHLTPLDLGKVPKARAQQPSLCTLNSPPADGRWGGRAPGSWDHEDVAGCLGAAGLAWASPCRPQPGPTNAASEEPRQSSEGTEASSAGTRLGGAQLAEQLRLRLGLPARPRSTGETTQARSEGAGARRWGQRPPGRDFGIS